MVMLAFNFPFFRMAAAIVFSVFPISFASKEQNLVINKDKAAAKMDTFLYHHHCSTNLSSRNLQVVSHLKRMVLQVVSAAAVNNPTAAACKCYLASLNKLVINNIEAVNFAMLAWVDFAKERFEEFFPKPAICHLPFAMAVNNPTAIALLYLSSSMPSPLIGVNRAIAFACGGFCWVALGLQQISEL